MQEKIKTQVPGCCQKCCSRKDLILSLCAVPPLLSFPPAQLISWLPVIPHCSLPRAASSQQWRSHFFLGSWLPPACQLLDFPLGITWPSSVYLVLSTFFVFSLLHLANPSITPAAFLQNLPKTGGVLQACGCPELPSVFLLLQGMEVEFVA